MTLAFEEIKFPATASVGGVTIFNRGDTAFYLFGLVYGKWWVFDSRPGRGGKNAPYRRIGEFDNRFVAIDFIERKAKSR